MLAFVTVCHKVYMCWNCLIVFVLLFLETSNGVCKGPLSVWDNNSRILVRLVNYHYYVDDQEAFKLLYQEASAVLERAMQKLVRLPIHVN